MKKEIDFYSYLTFLFWLFPGANKKRETELNISANDLTYKTEKLEGIAKALNYKLVFIIRYIPSILVLWLFGMFNFQLKIEYFYSLTLSIFFVLVYKQILSFKKNKLLLMTYIFVLILMSTTIVYLNDIVYPFYALLASIKLFIGVYAIFMIVEELRTFKKTRYFISYKEKLILKV